MLLCSVCTVFVSERIEYFLFQEDELKNLDMKEQDDVFKKFHDSFSGLKGHFHVLEQSVSVDRQMEYFRFSEKVKKEYPRLDAGDIPAVAGKLSEAGAPVEDIKLELVLLASSHEVKAYRILENYVNNPHPELKDWAQLALMESRMAMESDLSDEKQIFISTGLGGKGEKLRFFVLLLSADKKPFLEYQARVIEREFAYYLPKQDCEIEKLEVCDNYVILLFLVSVRANLKSILDYLIQECNQYGDFLSDLYTVTNVRELSDDEIRAIIEKDSPVPT